MKYFSDVVEIEIDVIRLKFKELCLRLHPDKGGDAEQFKEMMNEYELLIRRASSAEATRASKEERYTRFDYEGETDIAEMLRKIVMMSRIVIEICGSWIWLDGETRPHWETLKELGFWYSFAKKKCYWSPYKGEKRRRGSKSMNEIRSTYGSVIIENEKVGCLTK
jgi:hypothetical protein